jgi:hypothetical protein
MVKKEDMVPVIKPEETDKADSMATAKAAAAYPAAEEEPAKKPKKSK